MTASGPSPSRAPSQVWPPGAPTEPPARAKRSSPAAPETITSSPPLVTASGSPSPSTSGASYERSRTLMLAPSTGGSASPVRSPPYQVRAAYRGSHGWGHASTDRPARSAVRSSGGAGSAAGRVVGVGGVADAAPPRDSAPPATSAPH